VLLQGAKHMDNIVVPGFKTEVTYSD